MIGATALFVLNSPAPPANTKLLQKNQLLLQ
jgi:hypothetical protein